MTHDEALQVLKTYNAWRRDDSDKPEERLEMPCPKKIGQALDVAIAHIEKFRWRPIDEAPKGCLYLYATDRSFNVGELSENGRWADIHDFGAQPTHYMLIPTMEVSDERD